MSGFRFKGTSKASVTGTVSGQGIVAIPANSPELLAALGRLDGIATVRKFGRNDAVGTGSYEDIWTVGGDYNFLTAASAVQIAAGGNAADDAAGAGARSVTVVGLDENWAEATETITTAGASASSATTTTFIRVYRAYVANVGTYGGNNTGDITIETTGSTTVCQIDADLGQTQMAIYTVPAGKTAYLPRLHVGIAQSANKEASIRVWRRENADDVSAPFSGGKRLVYAFDEVSEFLTLDHLAFISFPEKTDIWASAIGTGGGTLVDVQFDLYVVDN